ncbi:MAG: hypothetical protein IJ438_10540 [Clostridia bacterium]|nr:hypothetical protein [Clostridia bacterium]
MLTKLQKAIMAHFSPGFERVYQPDCVPSTVAFPFLTVHVEPPCTPYGSGQVTCTAFYPCTAHTERMAALDALLSRVPVGGLILPLEEGAAVLYRHQGGQAAFPAVERGALAAQVCFSLKIYAQEVTALC